ncbi:hypothetical protein ACKI1W_48590, partial [Streptomyces europaeiscabiei]
QALELFLGRSTAAIAQHYGKLGRTVPDEFWPRLKSRVLGTFEGALQPIPDIGAVVSRLPSPFCVASSSDIDRVSLSLKVTGLAP